MKEHEYNLIEASKITKLAVRTLRKYINTGKIEARKDSGKWVITENELNRLGNENKDREYTAGVTES